MAQKGLIKPYFAKYGYDEITEKVTYSEGGIAGKAIEYSLACEKTDDNYLYADDQIVETDRGRFKSGTYTLGTAHMSQEISKTLLGVKEVTRQIGETSVTELVYDDDQKSVPVGIGIVEVHQVNGADKFRAVIAVKVVFNIPEESATTKGETIEWKTPSIEGSIERSDEETANYKHPWKLEAWFDSAAEAEEYIKTVLNITGGTE